MHSLYRGRAMLTKERQDIIRLRLAEDGRVLASSLAVEFHVSEDTVRRDLRDLARNGFCRRVYGGALSMAPDLGTIAERKAIFSEQKADIGRLTADLIESGLTVFIDAGSTNLAVVQALPVDRRLTIITNAPTVALALEKHHRCKVIIVGGAYDKEKGAIFGSQALREVQKIYIDVLLLGSCGLDPDAGITALDAEEAELKRCLIGQSKELIVAATNDKLGTVAPFLISETGLLHHLVLEATAPQHFIDAFSARGVQVHQTTQT